MLTKWAFRRYSSGELCINDWRARIKQTEIVPEKLFLAQPLHPALQTMSSFTESVLTKKLVDLNPTQQSKTKEHARKDGKQVQFQSLSFTFPAIQTLSLWLIHHRKHHESIVKLWLKELQNGESIDSYLRLILICPFNFPASKSKKLTFMFLANDVIQNSKRKGPEYANEFSKVLTRAFGHIRDACSEDKKTIESLQRILSIWLDRHVYDETQIADYRKALGVSAASSNGESTSDKKRRHEEVAAPVVVSPAKKSKVSKEHSKSEVEIEVNGKKETHVTLSPHEAFGEPPEPEELIRALQEIENSASSDVAVRQKIANLPLEYTEVSMLSKLENKDSALQLAKEVSDAVKLLNDYNNRLCHEMEDRKKLQVMLKDFAQEQRELVSQAESRLEVSGR